MDPTPHLEDFRAEARAWLQANAELRSGEENPAVVFPVLDPAEESARIAEARRWQARLFEAGWTGITWPSEYGGRDLSPIHQIAWTQESAPYAIPTEVFGIGLGMAGPTILTWGTEEQKNRWLRPMLRGDEIWCQLFSEPNAGSDVASVQTRAHRDGDQWVVNGQKAWTSGAHYSRWGLLLARTDPTATKHQGLTYFVVDMDQPGVEARPLRQMTGGSNFTEVFFSDARVPEANILGAPGMGWTVAVTTLMNERTSIGALGGLAGASGTAAVDRLISEIERRTGSDPSALPHVRARLTDVAVRLRVLRIHSQRIIAKLSRGEMPTAEGSIAKLLLTDLLERVATLGVDMQGPLGMLGGRDAPVDGSWAVALLGYPGMRIAGGTDEIMRNIIGDRVLDLPRELRVDRDLPFEDVLKNV